MDGESGDGTCLAVRRLRGQPRLGRRGHDGKHAAQVYPDAIRWLWKDWPNAVKAGEGSTQLREILQPSASWELVADGYKFTEGPAANSKGEVFFSDIPNAKTYKIGRDGAVSVFLADSRKGTGKPSDRMAGFMRWRLPRSKCSPMTPEGKATVVADGIRGNDLIVRHDGTIYRHQSESYDHRAQPSLVDSPGGREASGRHRLEVHQRRDVVARPIARSTWPIAVQNGSTAHQIQADGTLAHQQKYYHLHVPDSADDSGADGMCVDRDGRLYVATRMGVQVCDQAGRVNCIIPTPNGKVSNLRFGGENFDTLIAACGDRVFKRKLKVKGANAFRSSGTPCAPRL